MGDILKQLTAPVIITVLGVALVILGLTNEVTIGGTSLTISGGWKVATVIVIGVGLIGVGIYLVWREAPGQRPPASDAAAAASGGKPADVRAFDEMNTAFLDIKKRVEKGDLKITSAELIQHSSERAITLVMALARENVNIKLYLQHPDTLDVVCGDLKPRVLSRVSLYPQEMEGINYRGSFQIFFYKTPAALNGFRLTKRDGTSLLALGWYTYKSYKPLTNLVNSKFGGSANPCLIMDSTHPEYANFSRFFDDLIGSCERQGTPPVFRMNNGKYEWLAGWPTA
jgi:hypothetical protein